MPIGLRTKKHYLGSRNQPLEFKRDLGVFIEFQIEAFETSDHLLGDLVPSPNWGLLSVMKVLGLGLGGISFGVSPISHEALISGFKVQEFKTAPL